ncbi:MAG: glucan biosynthesis protein [Phreatobacter sp.]|uniref:glucan biosynthesis protein n=1 Tax=Phreatobacter sp. TaxID=1966341 RepID=UPI0027350890|nr:glucan biosynthesis protein [Phreatobacter sp.]MDP2803915.1 glucan biosynthesis protein [Phreatobacter sp.]
MPSRRALLASLLAAPAALTLTRNADAQSSPLQASLAAVSDGQPISRDALLAYAREVSRVAHQAPRNEVPRALTQLTLDQYRHIRMKPEQRIWAGENRGFTLDLLPTGNVFTNPVTIRTVDGGIIRDNRFAGDQYHFGQVPPLPADAVVPYSGFRAFTALNGDTPTDEALVFQGASLFRALAKGQVFGIMARALTLNVAEAQGEEYSAFRHFWIERPGPGAASIVVHALLDSDSVTGLYRFSVRPGDTTVCDVEVTLFPRVDLQHIGIAPMTANYLFAPNDRTNIDDVRGGVHEAQGLQVWNGNGEWIWRPVTNPETLQVSAFVDQNPRGFGLLQRDRRFEAFNDLDARFERRPSVWIEPLGEWGQGQVQLVEIPVNDEMNRNILAYWRPRTPLARGAEHFFTYRMHWCWSPPERPPFAFVSSSRTGRAQGGGRRRRFLVDFSSDEFADPARAGGLRANLTHQRGRVSAVDGRLVPELRLYRVSFDLDPETSNQVELRLVLEREGQAQSETWLYRWTP